MNVSVWPLRTLFIVHDSSFWAYVIISTSDPRYLRDTLLHENNDGLHLTAILREYNVACWHQFFAYDLHQKFYGGVLRKIHKSLIGLESTLKFYFSMN